MKNLHDAMKAAFLLGYDAPADAGGGAGGTATADPPAGGGSSGAGASGAGGTGGGAGGGDTTFSFFRNLPERKSTQETKTPEAGKGQETTPKGASGEAQKKYVVNDDNGKPIPGAEFATEAEAQAYIDAHKADGKTGADGAATDKGDAKTPEEIAAAVEKARVDGKTPEEIAALLGAVPASEKVKIAADALLETPILGRFTTIKAVEDYIRQSGAHAAKLAEEGKKLKADTDKALATRDAELAAVRAELEQARKTPPFKELTKEEEAKLAKDDPVAFQDYRDAKRDHAANLQKVKDEAVRRVAEDKRRLEDIGAAIDREVARMDADKEKYPMFREMDRMMGEIHKEMGGNASVLQRDPRSVGLLYDAALGRYFRQLMAKGKTVQKKAADDAKKTAETAARSTAGAGGGGTGAASVKTETPAEKDQKAWAARLQGVEPKKVLSFSD